MPYKDLCTVTKLCTNAKTSWCPRPVVHCLHPPYVALLLCVACMPHTSSKKIQLQTSSLSRFRNQEFICLLTGATTVRNSMEKSYIVTQQCRCLPWLFPIKAEAKKTASLHVLAAFIYAIKRAHSHT